MENFDFRPVPVGDIFDQAVRRFGARPAMDFFGQRTSYAQLGRLVERAAAGLQGLGVGRGVNVGLCLPNCPYFVVMYYAILKAGGTVVNFNPLYTAHEIEAQVRDAQVQIMVSLDLTMINDKIAPLAEARTLRQVVVCSMAAALPWRKGILFRLFKAKDIATPKVGGAYIRFEQLVATTQRLAPVAIDPGCDIAVLQFTGGTTGTPKAAMLTHMNVSVNLAQVRAIIPQVELGAERFLAVLPLFHVFAMTAILNLGLDIGAELVLLPRAEIKPLMATIRRTRPTLLPGVPTLFSAISNAAEAAKGVDLSFIKFCISGGAPISAEVLDRFERISHSIIVEGYGLSEASPVVTLNRAGAIKRGSVGQAVPGTVIEIRDQTDPAVLLAPGERGEICVRGPQVMRGYYQKPLDTSSTFIDGSLRTGDVGYLDEDGYLFISDRIKDLILCGGYNVYPRVIEEAAYQHPAVQDAIAIGVPDEYRGQAPKLYVSLRPGQHATEAEILSFLSGILNKIEMPKTLVIRASLPKTMVGKLSKKELVAEEATCRQSDAQKNPQ